MIKETVKPDIVPEVEEEEDDLDSLWLDLWAAGLQEITWCSFEVFNGLHVPSSWNWISFMSEVSCNISTKYLQKPIEPSKLSLHCILHTVHQPLRLRRDFFVINVLQIFFQDFLIVCNKSAKCKFIICQYFINIFHQSKSLLKSAWAEHYALMLLTLFVQMPIKLTLNSYVQHFYYEKK